MCDQQQYLNDLRLEPSANRSLRADDGSPRRSRTHSVTMSSGLVRRQVQQPVLLRSDQRVSARRAAPVQREQEAPFIPIVFLPPPCVVDLLVGIAVAQLVESAVGNLDRQMVGIGTGRQSTWDSPRPEHSRVLQAEVEVGSRSAVVVEYEGRCSESLICHNTNLLRRNGREG